MADSRTQNYGNHTRLDPWFHFFSIPVYAITSVGLLVMAIRRPGLHSAWLFVLSVAFIVHLFKTRMYALKVQNRVIRLEERLRLSTLLPPAMLPRLGELTLDQLIGLRFASDAEVPKLVEEALAKNMSKSQIKQAIQQWRADDLRV